MGQFLSCKLLSRGKKMRDCGLSRVGKLRVHRLSHFDAVLPQFFKRSCPSLILVDLFSLHTLSLTLLISQGLGAGFVTI